MNRNFTTRVKSSLIKSKRKRKALDQRKRVFFPIENLYCFPNNILVAAKLNVSKASAAAKMMDYSDYDEEEEGGFTGGRNNYDEFM